MSDGASLLNDLSNFIRRFVALTSEQADVCALWIVHTHAIEGAEFTPYLNITSPLPQSGKTTLLQLLGLLAANPWYTGHVTAAVLVRKTDKDHPTLLLDESDAAFQSNREYSETVRGVLNTGYERGGTHAMCVPVGKEWMPRDFLTFSPKAIAGIGRLPDTVEDRSIPIRLKRKLPSQQCEAFRRRKVRPEAEGLRGRATKWSKRNIKTLTNAEPQMPQALNDRQQDVCEPLLSIADLVGNEWPDRARQALIVLFTAQGAREDSRCVRLLSDMRSYFENSGADRVKSSTLLEHLTSNEESPWNEFDRGFPLTTSGLARLLKPFDIRPRDLRFDCGVFKGYERADFEDAWSRYLPSPPLIDGPEGQQASVYAGSSDFSEGQQTTSVAASKSEESPVDMRVVADVAPVQGDKGNGSAGLEIPWCSHSRESWWQRRDGGWVCGACHPNPAQV